MTLKKAQSITRLRIEPTPLYAPKCGFIAFDDRGFMCAWGSGTTEKDALEKLVACNYKRVCDAAMERARYKCEQCGTYTVQAHHVVYRSHGRVDTVESIQILCPACHAIKHKEVKGLEAKIKQMGLAEERVR